MSNLIVLPLFLVFGILGYFIGLEHGSPILDIKEIVWTANHEPLRMRGFNLQCILIPEEYGL